MLNIEEIKRYHEDGYIIPEFKMPENDLLEIEKLHDELIKKNPQFLNYCPAVLEYEEKFLKYCFNDKILNVSGLASIASIFFTFLRSSIDAKYLDPGLTFL